MAKNLGFILFIAHLFVSLTYGRKYFRSDKKIIWDLFCFSLACPYFCRRYEVKVHHIKHLGGGFPCRVMRRWRAGGGLPSRLDSLVEADADSALRLMGQDGERGLVAPRCNVAGAFAGQGDITLQAKTVIIKNSTTVSFGTKLKIVKQ